MNYPPVASKTVVVTGASSGIGFAIVQELRSKGWHVIPTVRKPEDMANLREHRFTPVELDVTDSASIRRAYEEVLKLTEGRVGALVNNAGYGQPGAVEDLSRNLMRAQFETNVFGLQELTNLFIPAFRQQGYGRIVNVSSVLGRINMPFLGLYCASKHALESLSDALRIELADSGVAVSIIEPGPIESKFRARAVSQAEDLLANETSYFADYYKRQLANRRDYSRPTDRFTKPPSAVAVKVAHALESSRPKIRYCVTFPAYLGAFASRFLPDWLTDMLMSSQLGKPAQNEEQEED